MIFSEKMSRVPQPRRADLWTQYRTLCTALALQVTVGKENRSPTEEELTPLKQAAETANSILSEYGMTPSFFPQQNDFFCLLTEELTKVAHSPKRND